MERMAVFVFWERKGVVRDYIILYLKGLQEIASKIYVVCNGEINDSGRLKIEKMGIVVLQRKNIGVDFWAYKTALDYAKDLHPYDEIILCNCSCYGPVYPFSEMFHEMEKKNIDFWGITEWPYDQGGYKGSWILSYFMVFNKKVFLSNEWTDYWKNLSPVFSREECIEKHEAKFTKYFIDKGFVCDVYCHNTINWMDSTIEAPDELVVNYRCPVIKRKAFCVDYERLLSYHRGKASRSLFDFLKQQNLYDTNVILDDLLATQHYANIKDCLQEVYVLSSIKNDIPLLKKPKVIICVHLYYEDLLDRYFDYIKKFPEYIDIFITTPKKYLVDKIYSAINKHGLKNVKVEVINARGRAESAFLVATKNFILDYDYACILHDKKSSFLYPGSKGIEFGFHNWDSLVPSKVYIENILAIFEQNQRIGILEPVNLMYGDFEQLYGNEWGANFEGTVDLLRKSSIDIPIDINVPPVAPMGAMFWFRPMCLKRLLDIDWDYADFPEEPLPLDGSLIHFIERAYPFYAQAAGYLTCWCTSSREAENQLVNLAFLYRKVNVLNSTISHENMIIRGGMACTQNNSTIGLKGALKNYLKKHLPKSVITIYHKTRR